MWKTVCSTRHGQAQAPANAEQADGSGSFITCTRGAGPGWIRRADGVFRNSPSPVAASHRHNQPVTKSIPRSSRMPLSSRPKTSEPRFKSGRTASGTDLRRRRQSPQDCRPGGPHTTGTERRQASPSQLDRDRNRAPSESPTLDPSAKRLVSALIHCPRGKVLLWPWAGGALPHTKGALDGGRPLIRYLSSRDMWCSL